MKKVVFNYKMKPPLRFEPTSCTLRICLSMEVHQQIKLKFKHTAILLFLIHTILFVYTQ